jgi:hypothetical protein
MNIATKILGELDMATSTPPRRMGSRGQSPPFPGEVSPPWSAEERRILSSMAHT